VERNGKTYSRSLTLNTLHLLESFIQRSRSLLQSGKYIIILLFIEFITLLTFNRWMHHRLNDALSKDRRAKLDRHKLVNLSNNVLVKTNKLVVTTSVSAFTDHTFTDRVEGSKFDVVILAWLGLL
jgi:hypothetical protein